MAVEAHKYGKWDGTKHDTWMPDISVYEIFCGFETVEQAKMGGKKIQIVKKAKYFGEKNSM